MSSVTKMVGIDRAFEIRDAMIQVARNCAGVDGATQSEMRQAQGEWLHGILNEMLASPPMQPEQEVPWHGQRPERVCEAIAQYWAEWEENRAGTGAYLPEELAEDGGEFATGLFDHLAALTAPEATEPTIPEGMIRNV